MRKLDDNFIKALNEGILKPILVHVKGKKEILYCGIRNNEFDIYYRGGALAKIYSDKDNNYYSEFDFEYATVAEQKEILEKLDNLKISYSKQLYKTSKDKNKYKLKINLNNKTCVDNFCKLIDLNGLLTTTMNNYFIKSKNKKLERQAQHLMAVKNEQNKEAKYTCVDIEYTQNSTNDIIPFGRFDMILISKEKKDFGIEQKYNVVVVELKIGSNYGTNTNDVELVIEKAKAKDEKINTKLDEKLSYGSGVTGHFADFYRFMKNGNYDVLKEDIEGILYVKNKLGLVNIDIKREDLSLEPEFWFITLCTEKNNKRLQIESCINSLKNNISKNKYCVKNMFSEKEYNELKDWNNIKFCFYKGNELVNKQIDVNINDIVNLSNYEIIENNKVFV